MKMNTEQLDNARRDFMRLVDVVLKGTQPEVSAAILKLERAAWQFAKLRQSYEPLIQREAMMRAPNPVITPTPHVPDGETLSAPQPAPKPTTGTPIWELVIADMLQRDRLGRARYGTPLQAFNGRDALVDAYQESLDQCAYLRQAIEERKANAPPAERRAACVDAVPDGETRDPLTDPREGDWFVDGNDASVRRVVLADDIKVLYEVDGELTEMSIDAWRMYRASGHARPMTPSEVAAFKRDGTRPTVQPTEDEMAAELREAGWSEGSGWRSPRDTLFAWHRYTADAYAAMRAAKGAK